MSATLHYQAGGTLSPEAIYVSRPGDAQLCAELLKGHFCYVLAPRQIGKSSLRARTSLHLRSSGIHCVNIDLNGVGSRLDNLDAWYFSLADEIAHHLAIPRPVEFWSVNAQLTPMHRFERYLRAEVLQRVPGQIVLFIDEIDTLLARSDVERDEFFAVIRAIYNARPDVPSYQRLSICLLGVAQPRDLISDDSRTPFNIGRAIRLEDFTRQQMETLSLGLLNQPATPAQLLDEIFFWTHGHPFMTLRLCEAVGESEGPEPNQSFSDWIQALVGELFLPHGRALEPTLNFAAKHFGRNSKRSYASQMLRLYEQVRAGLEIVADAQDPVQSALRLTGMVAERIRGDRRVLAVRNRIYASVFNEAWVASFQKERLFAEPLRRWVSYGKPSTQVLRGRLLEDARDWMQGREDITADEREFLLASLEVCRQEEEQWQKARMRRIYIWTLGCAALILIPLFVSVLLYHKDRVAKAHLAVAVAEGGLHAQFAAIDPLHRKDALIYALNSAKRSLELHNGLSAETLQGLIRVSNPILARQVAQGTFGRVQHTTFSPNGQYRAIFGFSESVWIWNAPAGLLIRTLNESSVVHDVAFSPDSHRLVTASADGIARVYDVASGEFLLSLIGHKKQKRLFAASYSPDGSKILTASEDESAIIWDARTGSRLQVLKDAALGHHEWVRMGIFSPDGQRVITVGDDRCVGIWDVATGRVLSMTERHNAIITAVALSPDGRQYATASDDRSARIWNTTTGELVGERLSHPAPVRSVSFSPDGRHLFTSGDDAVTRIWSVDGGQLVMMLDNPSGALTSVTPHSPGISEMISAVAPEVENSVVKLLYGHKDWVRTTAFSPDGREIVTASADGTVRLWNAETGQSLKELQGHKGEVRSAQFSSDGQRIVTCGHDMTVRIWDHTKATELRVLRGHQGWIRWAAFSPDGSRVVSASKDKTARVWDVSTGEPLLTLRGHKNYLRTAAYSPDGTRIATGADDARIIIWDASTGEYLKEMSHGDSVWTLDFSQDGTKLLSASSHQSIIIWDVASGQPWKRFVGHKEGINSARYSRDNRKIVSAGVDRTIRVWNAEDQQAVAPIFEFHSGEVRWADFSPDGKRVVSGGNDSLAFIFPVEGEPWLVDVCRSFNRYVQQKSPPLLESEDLIHFCAEHSKLEPPPGLRRLSLLKYLR